MKLNWNILYDLYHTYISFSVDLLTVTDNKQNIYQCKLVKEFTYADLIFYIISAIGAGAALFAFFKAYMVIKTRYIPKYRYTFEYGEKNNQPITLKLYLSRMEINYQITEIGLSSKTEEPIISYSIDNRYEHNKHTTKFKKNNAVELWDCIQPISEELKQANKEEVLLEIKIPFSDEKNRKIRICFEFDKFPYTTFMVITIPPKNHYII